MDVSLVLVGLNFPATTPNEKGEEGSWAGVPVLCNIMFTSQIQMPNNIQVFQSSSQASQLSDTWLL